MTTSTLWIKRPTLTVEENIRAAMKSYEKNFGEPAAVVFVNPDTESPAEVDGAQVIRRRRVPAGILWVGGER